MMTLIPGIGCRMFVRPQAAQQSFTFVINATSANYEISSSNIRFGGTAGKTLNIAWGDGNDDDLTLLTGGVGIGHIYAAAADYTVTVTGDLDDWKLIDWVFFNVTLDVTTLPISVTDITMMFLSANVTGNIHQIAGDYTSLHFNYCSGLTGNIGSLKSSLTKLTLNYAGTSYTGNIADLPSGLTLLAMNGAGSGITGLLENLPTGLTKIQFAAMSGITGSINSFGGSLTTLDLFGMPTTITGDVSNLPSAMTYLRFQSNTQITGDFTELPATLTYLSFANNNMTGDLADLGSLALYYLSLRNNSNFTGNIGDLPTSLGTLEIDTAGTAINYTTSLDLTNTYTVRLRTVDLSQSEVDAVLADIVTAGRTNGNADLRGNAAPSVTGEADIAILQSRGWNVYTE